MLVRHLNIFSRQEENIWGNIGEKLQRKESQSMKISSAGFSHFPESC